MKVALCLSGQPRVVEVGYHKLRASILDHNDVDVFIHTWFDKDNLSTESVIPGREGHQLDPGAIDKLIEIYQPKRILVDKPKNWGQYIYPKGYIALNGVSLTVGKVSDESFSVYLIPETIRSTNLLTVEDGARLNLEIDQGIMASYENKKNILKNIGEDE